MRPLVRAELFKVEEIKRIRKIWYKKRFLF